MLARSESVLPPNSREAVAKATVAGEFDWDVFSRLNGSSIPADALPGYAPVEHSDLPASGTVEATEPAVLPFDLRTPPPGFQRVTLYEGVFDAGPSFGSVTLTALSEAGWEEFSKSGDTDEKSVSAMISKFLVEAVSSWTLVYPRGTNKGKRLPPIHEIPPKDLHEILRGFPARMLLDLQRAIIFLSSPDAGESKGS